MRANRVARRAPPIAGLDAIPAEEPAPSLRRESERGHHLPRDHLPSECCPLDDVDGTEGGGGAAERIARPRGTRLRRRQDGQILVEPAPLGAMGDVVAD